MAAKKDFSKDTADIFGLRQRKEMEAKQKPSAVSAPKAAEKQAKAPAAVMDAPLDLTTKTFRITQQQHRALKLRMATSERAEEKDLSSIVRAALDAYLAEELGG